MTSLRPLQVRLVVEVLWPLFLFLILVWVRTTSQPFHKGQCKYQPFSFCGGTAAFTLRVFRSSHRSLPKQSHAVSRHAALAPGYDLQHGQPLSEPSHAGRDAGPSQQLQQHHVLVHSPPNVPSDPLKPPVLCLTVSLPPQIGRRADRSPNAVEDTVDHHQAAVARRWRRPPGCPVTVQPCDR